MLTLKPSNFRPAHRSRANFDSRIKSMSSSVLILKPRQSVSHTPNQVHFDPNAEVKSISMPTLKTSEVGMPPDTNAKLISI